MKSADYKLVSANLWYADKALEIFKIDLSPTSLDSIAKHIARHVHAMQSADPKPTELIAVIVGLMLKLTCDKEVQAFLKAEEAADADDA